MKLSKCTLKVQSINSLPLLSCHVAFQFSTDQDQDKSCTTKTLSLVFLSNCSQQLFSLSNNLSFTFLSNQLVDQMPQHSVNIHYAFKCLLLSDKQSKTQ